MFNPLTKGIREQAKQKQQNPKQQPKPNQTNKTEGKMKTAMIVKVDFPVEIKNSE